MTTQPATVTFRPVGHTAVIRGNKDSLMATGDVHTEPVHGERA